MNTRDLARGSQSGLKGPVCKIYVCGIDLTLALAIDSGLQSNMLAEWLALQKAASFSVSLQNVFLSSANSIQVKPL